jgi:hypothetical protein
MNSLGSNNTLSLTVGDEVRRDITMSSGWAIAIAKAGPASAFSKGSSECQPVKNTASVQTVARASRSRPFARQSFSLSAAEMNEILGSRRRSGDQPIALEDTTRFFTGNRLLDLRTHPLPFHLVSSTP